MFWIVRSWCAGANIVYHSLQWGRWTYGLWFYCSFRRIFKISWPWTIFTPASLACTFWEVLMRERVSFVIVWQIVELQILIKSTKCLQDYLWKDYIEHDEAVFIKKLIVNHPFIHNSQKHALGWFKQNIFFVLNIFSQISQMMHLQFTSCRDEETRLSFCTHFLIWIIFIQELK